MRILTCCVLWAEGSPESSAGSLVLFAFRLRMKTNNPITRTIPAMPAPAPMPSIEEPERLVGGVASVEGEAVAIAEADLVRDEAAFIVVEPDSIVYPDELEVVVAADMGTMRDEAPPMVTELASSADVDMTVEPGTFELPGTLVELDVILLLLEAPAVGPAEASPDVRPNGRIPFAPSS